MKKTLLLISAISLSLTALPQGNGNNSNWKINGNSISTGDYLGTSNSQELVFKTNGNEGFRLDLGGNLVVGGYVPGIPAAKISVNGDIIATGSISADVVNVVNFVKSSRGVMMQSAFCLEGNDGTAGSTNRMWTMNGDFFLQSHSNYNYNTVINGNNVGNVGIGTLTPQAKLDVGGDVIFRNNVTIPNIPAAVDPLNLNVLMTDPTGAVSTSDMDNLMDIIYGPCDLALAGGGSLPPHWTSEIGEIYAICDVKVGIGTDDPLYKLDVRGNGYFSENMGLRTIPSSFSTLKIDGSNYGAALEIEQNNTSDYSKLLLLNYTNPTTEIIKVVNAQTNQVPFLLEASGKMTIHNGTEKILQLEESGLLHARKIRVDTQAWPDYVFTENYVLKPLQEVEAYIQKEKHLPEVPSQEVVLNEGIDLSEMNVLLMQKIEELTLYIIEQDKTLRAVQEDVHILQGKLNTCGQ